MKNTENGFTLVEIALVMLITGLVTAAFVSAYLRWKDILQETHTNESIAVISDAMSAYVSLNYRIPCPADPSRAGAEPFGTEIGSGANGADRGNCSNPDQWEGIVPFAALGLDASAAQDGWGNYFTYQISPAFTDNLDVTTQRIHAKCRTTDWIEGATLDSATNTLDGGRNLHHRKANFCCIEPDGNEINIYSDAARSPSVIYDQDPAAWYDTTDIPADPYNATDPLYNAPGQSFYNINRYGGGAIAGVSGHTDMVVYALISHGQNGDGAFLPNGTRTVPQGTLELINAATNDGPAGANGPDGNEDQAIFDLPHNSSNGANFYDDIVQWQTQSDIMARLRRGSCALP